jgi:hypothetical protein
MPTNLKWEIGRQPTLREKIKGFFEPLTSFLTGLTDRERGQKIVDPRTKEVIRVEPTVPTKEVRLPFAKEPIPVAKEKPTILPTITSTLLETIPRAVTQTMQNYREITAMGRAEPLKLPFDARRLGFDKPEIESTGVKLNKKFDELNELNPPQNELDIWKNAGLSSLMVVVPDSLDAFIAGSLAETGAKLTLKATKYDPMLERSMSQLGISKGETLTSKKIIDRTKESILQAKNINEYAEVIRSGRYVAEQYTGKGVAQLKPLFQRIQDTARDLILPLEQYGMGFQVSPVAPAGAGLPGYMKQKLGLSISPRVGGDEGLAKKVTELAKQGLKPEVIAKQLDMTKPAVDSIIKMIPKVEGKTAFEKLTNYYKSISSPKVTVEKAKELGIALRTTKAGKVVPAIRKTGPFVPETFANYQNFQDVSPGIFGGTKEITRAIQQIDGSLSLAKKVQLPGQAGPAEQDILWRTRDITKLKLQWIAEKETSAKEAIKGISDKDAEIANKVIEKISRKGSYVDPAELAKNPAIARITTDKKIIEFAQTSRKIYENLLKEQNTARALRNQKPIPYREYYTAHEIQDASLWERAFGLKKEPVDIMSKPELPDYIKPDAPFNPREVARQSGLKEYEREMNLKKLLENYINTAAKDIFDTSIVQNNKAFVQQLESMGLPNSARLIQDWTAEAFAGVNAAGDRWAALNPTLKRGMTWWRQGLIRGVFPLNFAWNTIVQTSSAVLTTTRTSYKSQIQGLNDWLFDGNVRKEIQENAYSAIIKNLKVGKLTRQDINAGISRAADLERKPIEKAVDAVNYMTEWTEKHLTGWSIATHLREGKARGLEGKALWEYASDGGAKTQSMYNMEDLPGILRSELVKTAAPFNTFSFEVFNTLREFAGKTGTPPGTVGERIKWILRFLAGAYAVNAVGQAAIGRKPWEGKSAIPFYGTLFAPIVAALKGENVETASTRGLPSPVGIGIQGAQGMYKYIEKGDTRPLRNWAIRYLPGLAGIPGGTQAARTVDGIIAISDGGLQDRGGRMIFPITDFKDQFRAVFAGPWSTAGGQEYWEKREKSWLDLIGVEREEKEELPRLELPPLPGAKSPQSGVSLPPLPKF